MRNVENIQTFDCSCLLYQVHLTYSYINNFHTTQYMLLLTEFCVRQQKEARSKIFEGDLFDYWHEVHIAGNKTNKKYSKL